MRAKITCAALPAMLLVCDGFKQRLVNAIAFVELKSKFADSLDNSGKALVDSGEVSMGGHVIEGKREFARC